MLLAPIPADLARLRLAAIRRLPRAQTTTTQEEAACRSGRNAGNLALGDHPGGSIYPQGQTYWLSIGKIWRAIKKHPFLDEIGGIKGLKPYLPHQPQWLNRCAVAFDGYETGDRDKGEKFIAHTNYKLQHEYEPYKMAETVEVWRNRLRPRRSPRLPLAITAGRLFVRSEVESFEGHGSVALGDCHKLITDIPDGIVDAVITDPPYGFWGEAAAMAFRGKVQHEWDQPLDWDSLWPEIWRVLSRNGTVVIAAGQPLASQLVVSQVQYHPWNWRWFHKATNMFGPRQHRPLDVIEDIAVFSRANHKDRTSNLQMRPRDEVEERLRQRSFRLLPNSIKQIEASARGRLIRYSEYAPVSLVEAPRTEYDSPRIMFGQKPVSLMRYLIRTHTNPGDLILDISAGAMTTCVACILEKSKFLAFESFRPHFVLGTRRLRDLIHNN